MVSNRTALGLESVCSVSGVFVLSPSLDHAADFRQSHSAPTHDPPMTRNNEIRLTCPSQETKH